MATTPEGDEFYKVPAIIARYGITRRTLTRWIEEADLNGFPAPLVMNGRYFWRISDIVAWERSTIKAVAG